MSGFMTVYVVIKDVRDDPSEIIAVYDSEELARKHVERLPSPFNATYGYYYESHEVLDSLQERRITHD